MFSNHHTTLIVSLCIMIFQASLFASDSNNSPTIKPIPTKKQSGPQIEFEFSIKEKGDYYLSFAMYGNFDEKYNVLIDGNKKGVLYMISDGLQNVFLQKTVEGLDDKTVSLNKGAHTITILGNKEWEIPNILEIKVGENYEETVFSFPKPSVQTSKSLANEQLLSTAMGTTDYCPDCYVQDRGNSYYDYKIIGPVSFYGHTYKTDFNLTAGTNIMLKVDKINGYWPTIYLFKIDNTGNNTWRAYNTGTLTQTIPAGGTGTYRCMLLGNMTEGATYFYWSFNGGASWSVHYDCRVKMGTWQTLVRDNINTGVRFFTAKQSGDPVMYLLNSSNLVVACNDDYYPIYDTTYSESQNSWRLNSGCSWSGAPSAHHVTVLLFEYTYFYGSGSADLYGFVKGTVNSSQMTSSTQSIGNYNCFAWSGGISASGFGNWDPNTQPYNHNIDFSQPYYFVNAFDNFYGNRINRDGQIVRYSRYAGAPNYVRCNAAPYEYNAQGKLIGSYATDAVIDLWGSDANNIVHASVSKNANYQYHGVEWESKDGTGYRSFHSRTKPLLGYNHIIYSYRPETSLSTAFTALSSGNTSNALAAEQTTVAYASTPKMEAMGINHPLSFDSSVALGLTVLRNAAFTEYENKEIDGLASDVSADISNEYHLKFSAWEKTRKDSSMSFKFAQKRNSKSKEHSVFKDFYTKHKEKVWPLLIKMVKEKKVDKNIILEDALSDSPMGESIIDEINNELSVEQYTQDGALIFTTNDDRCIMLCKKMLSRM